MTLTLIQPLEELHDSALVGKSLRGNQEAFAVLMRRYLKAVYSYILGTVHDVPLAEDLTQETFLRVYRSLKQFDQNRLFKPWLFTIATNVSKSALKKQQRQPILLTDSSAEANWLENQEDPQASELCIPDLGVADSVAEALGKLSPNIRQALILRHVYDLTYEQVAGVLQANTNTVRTWLKRGREALKYQLEPQEGVSHGRS